MDFTPLTEAPPQILVHAAAALAAIPLGLFAWLRRSRDIWHRVAGWAFVGAMTVAAVSATFVQELRIIGPLSPIHAFIPLVMFELWRGVARARGRKIAEHARIMTSLYVQALGIAGLFTLLSGRIMSRMLFPAAPWTGFALAALALAALLVWHRLRTRRPEPDRRPHGEAVAD